MEKLIFEKLFITTKNIISIRLTFGSQANELAFLELAA